ncbi:MAG: transposase [Bacteroidales bacterium]|nr:transposase [Bacteroidales bacterium]
MQVIFYSKIDCGKDTLYRFKRDNSICIRLTKKSKWRTIITTDVDLDFERAMEIYAMRWSIEVFFKECKQHLLLNSCQSVDFDAQIAEITFSFIRFNILSTILRKQKYDTMGGLFEEITKDTLELTINERIILFIRNLIENIKEQLYDYKNTLLIDLNIDNQSVRKIIKLE